MNGLAAGVLSDRIERTLRDEVGLGVVHHLRDEVFAPCQGCWECWVAKPGTCKVADAANGVMRDIIGADVVVFTTRLRFGCWSSVSKAALDKSIGLLSPFFSTVEGETHHESRYRRYPRWYVIAVVDDATTARERATFRALVARNALNMHAEVACVDFVPQGASDALVRTIVRSGVAELRRAPSPFAAVEPARQLPGQGVAKPLGRAPHALLWVGSAKPHGTSTSEALGRYLLEQLASRSWTSEVVFSANAVKLGRSSSPKLVEAFQRADLVVMAAPVYVDSLPALVLSGLAHLAEADLGLQAPSVLPLLQSGFPELAHSALAVEILSIAAERIGLPWAGHLAAGAGGMVNGRDLTKLGGSAYHLRRGLDRAALEIDGGSPISQATADEFATLPVSHRTYRALGQVGWIAAAARHGSLLKLWDAPFPEADGGSSLGE